MKYCCADISKIPLLSLTLYLLMWGGAAVYAVDSVEPASNQLLVVETADILWEKALAADKQNDTERAARLFLRVHDEFPDFASPPGNALLRAARLYKTLALVDADPDWEQVRNLFRWFNLDYRDSPYAAEAYLEIGIAHFHMRFLREALSYFRLFAERYSASPLLPLSRYWQAKVLAETGQLDEAVEIYQGLVDRADEQFQKRILLSLGKAFDAKGKYRKALATYQQIMSRFPNYHFENLDLLINLGKMYFKVGKEEKGRKHLFYYLNVVEPFARRIEVLFELAESFLRQGDDSTAQTLYAMVVRDGKPQARATILAVFRQAEYRDDPGQLLPEWQKKGDLTDPAGDQPFLAVLDLYRTEPIAQDARFGLFLRYKARNNFEDAMRVGRSFLRHDNKGATAARQPDPVKSILFYLAEEMLNRHEYQQLYALYVAKHQHVLTIKDGRLLFMVGQALEALSLYQQASVIYFRALGLSLADQDKIELYYRRAEVYLTIGNRVSANRLLTHLRNIYQGKQEVGEIYYLSGRLLEDKGDFVAALVMYDNAIAVLTCADRKHIYIAGRLRMLLMLAKYEEMIASLHTYQEEELFVSADLQVWYVKLGDMLRTMNMKQQAVEVYLAVLAENMPQGGEIVQSIQLSLGELFFALGEMEKSHAYFLKAMAGDNPLKRRVAEQGLGQVEISQMVSELDNLLREP